MMHHATKDEVRPSQHIDQKEETFENIDETLKDGSIFGLSFRLKFWSEREKQAIGLELETGFRSFFDDSISFVKNSNSRNGFYDEYNIVLATQHSTLKLLVFYFLNHIIQRTTIYWGA